jgi:uncharacterized protein (DUF362 family)
VSVTRRVFLAGGALALASACRGGRDAAGPDVRPPLSRVAILPAATYQAELAQRVRAGLRECRLDVRGRRVVLKPNLVEFDPQGAINTHPALIAAAAEAFLLEGARRVVVAEGPGHRRDNEYLLAASGLDALLRERRLSYVDLNFDDLRLHPLRSRFSALGQLYLPRTVMEADLFVSMPKLKTHHWAGVTLAMKNLFGIVPGAVYGWPKNPLHWAGIDASIVDLASTIPSRRFAIVDGIVGMEGNGPIQGEAKSVGVLVMGDDFVAVDATCARLMGLAPERVGYIAAAGEFLGNAGEERIEQIAEPISRHVSPFAVLPAWDHLRA